MEWHHHHGKIRLPWFLPPCNKNSASVHRPKCLWAICGIQQQIPRDLGESWSPMHQIIGRQTLLLTMDLSMSHEPALACQPWYRITLTYTVTQRQELLWYSSFQRYSSIPWEREKNKKQTKKTFGCLDAWEWVKGTFFTLCTGLIPPRWHSLEPRPRKNYPGLQFLPQGERENIWVGTWFSQLCRTLPKGFISLLPHPEHEIWSFITGEQKKSGRVADRSLRGH